MVGWGSCSFWRDRVHIFRVSARFVCGRGVVPLLEGMQGHVGCVNVRCVRTKWTVAGQLEGRCRYAELLANCAGLGESEERKTGDRKTG